MDASDGKGEALTDEPEEEADEDCEGTAGEAFDEPAELPDDLTAQPGHTKADTTAAMIISTAINEITLRALCDPFLLMALMVSQTQDARPDSARNFRNFPRLTMILPHDLLYNLPHDLRKIRYMSCYMNFLHELSGLKSSFRIWLNRRQHFYAQNAAGRAQNGTDAARNAVNGEPWTNSNSRESEPARELLREQAQKQQVQTLNLLRDNPMRGNPMQLVPPERF